MFLQLGDEGREVAWIGDQYVLPAQEYEQQAVRCKAKDVVKRQWSDQNGGVWREYSADPGAGLHDVGNDVAVREHRALGDPGGSAGVLQECQIVVAEVHGIQGQTGSFRQGLL